MADHLPPQSGFRVDSRFPDEMREGGCVLLGLVAEGAFVGSVACLEVACASYVEFALSFSF